MEIVLGVSVLINLILLPYSIRCARRLMTVANNLSSLQDKFAMFSAHVKVIHESEMFYGDETLQALIDHSKDILEDLDQYEDIYNLVDEQEGEEIELDQSYEEAQTEN